MTAGCPASGRGARRVDRADDGRQALRCTHACALAPCAATGAASRAAQRPQVQGGAGRDGRRSGFMSCGYCNTERAQPTAPAPRTRRRGRCGVVAQRPPGRSAAPGSWVASTPLLRVPAVLLASSAWSSSPAAEAEGGREKRTSKERDVAPRAAKKGCAVANSLDFATARASTSAAIAACGCSNGRRCSCISR